MRISGRFLLFALVVVLGVPGVCLAQDEQVQVDPNAQFEEVLSDEQIKELEAWIPKAIEWLVWEQRVRNTVDRTYLLERVKQRKGKPKEPEWLAAECAFMKQNIAVRGEDVLSQGCRLFTDMYSELFLILNTNQTYATQRRQWDIEVISKTNFMSHLHLDVRNQVTQTGVPVHSIVGLHMSIVTFRGWMTFNSGGFQVVSLPSIHGGRRKAFGINLGGFGVKLLQIGWPKSDLVSDLHLNIQKVVVPNEQQGTYIHMDFGGFSISMPYRKKTPPKP